MRKSRMQMLHAVLEGVVGDEIYTFASLHQAIYDVVHGKFPVTEKEAIFLAALRAQQTVPPRRQQRSRRSKKDCKSGSRAQNNRALSQADGSPHITAFIPSSATAKPTQ